MKILIVNVHSALNLGDDAIMGVTLQAINRRYPDAQVLVAANDPESWKKYNRIEAIPSLCSWIGDCRLGKFRRKAIFQPIFFLLLLFAAFLFRVFHIQFNFGNSDRRRLLAAYYQADLVFSCGGGNFYAYRTFSPALVWGLMAVRFAEALGKRTILLPQSIGPIQGSFQRWLAAAVFRKADHIYCREQRSIAFIHQALKVDREIPWAPDLGFGLDVKSKAVFPEASLKIGVTVINRGQQLGSFTGQDQYEQALENALVWSSQELQAEIHIFVQCHGPSPDQDDQPVSQRLFERLKTKVPVVFLHEACFDAVELQIAFARMDLVIGTRLHTAIFALSSGTPVALIGYQPKSLGTMEALGLERFCLDIDRLSREELEGFIREIKSKNLALRQDMHALYKNAQQQVKQLFEVCLG